MSFVRAAPIGGPRGCRKDLLAASVLTSVRGRDSVGVETEACTHALLRCSSPSRAGLHATLASEIQKAGSGQLFCGQRKRSAYLTCLPIRPAISNMETWGLPKTSLSLASALIMRLLAASCRLLALM